MRLYQEDFHILHYPPEINLADPTFSDFYKKALYTLDNGQAVFGEPIYFSITIPESVKNPDGAMSFVKFLLSSKGERILETQGLNYLKPAHRRKHRQSTFFYKEYSRTDKTINHSEK